LFSSDVLLAVVDTALLGSLAFGWFLLMRLRPPVVRDVREAYQVLDRTIERFVPDMPPGFTWRDAFERLKTSGMNVDWPKMESSLAGYEAFRYGGRDMPPGGGEEAVSLSTQIRRRIVGHKAKGKSTGAD